MLRFVKPMKNRAQILSFLRGVSLVGIYGGLLMPLFFSPLINIDVIFPFVFSKLIFFQILVGLTFPFYLLLAWMEPSARPKWHLLYGAIGAYFVALLLSVVFSFDPLRSWWGNQERMNGLFTLLHFFAWLTMAVGVLKTWPQWRRLLNYQVGLSIVMAIFALLQKPFPNLLGFPAGPRVGGLLDNPIYMASYQIFNFAFLALLALKNSSRTARITYGMVALVDLAAFLAAQSRGALVGLAAGLLVFAFCVAIFSQNKKARYGALGGVALIFVLYGLLFSFRHTDFVQHSSLARLTNFSASTGTRFIAWRIAWEGFLDRPLFGWGLDTFHHIFNLNYNPQSLGYALYETWFDRSHNTVLDVLSMTGIFGFITFFGIFGALFWSLWGAYRKGWMDLRVASILVALPVAYFVQNLFVFDHPAAFSMSFLMYGLIIAATRPTFIGQSESASVSSVIAKTRGFSFWLLGLFFVPFALIVWRASVLPFYVSILSIKANTHVYLDDGFGYAKRASEFWTPYLDEQTFLLSRNLMTVVTAGQLQQMPHWKETWELTKQITMQEIQRHPMNTQPYFVYGQLALTMMDTVPEAAKIAEEQYKKAIQTSPKRQQLFFNLARLYERQGRIDEAMALQKQARDFDVEVGETRWSYGLALFYTKQDRTEGAKELAASQTAQFPHALASVTEAEYLADAYLTLNDVDGLKKLALKIATLPAGKVDEYARIALRLHAVGLAESRDAVLNFGATIDHSIGFVFDSLLKQANQAKP